MDRDERIVWEAYEYEPRKKSGEWYAAVGITTLAVVVTTILLNNVLFGILFAIGVFALVLYTARPPQLIHLEISARGITIDGTLYPFGTLESFWISDSRITPRLLFKSKKVLMPAITMPLPDDIDPDDVADILIDFLPEIEHDESLSEHIADRLGF